MTQEQTTTTQEFEEKAQRYDVLMGCLLQLKRDLYRDLKEGGIAREKLEEFTWKVTRLVTCCDMGFPIQYITV